MEQGEVCNQWVAYVRTLIVDNYKLIIIKNPNTKSSGFLFYMIFDIVGVAGVMELVDMQDLKFCGQQCPCGFESHPRHNQLIVLIKNYYGPVAQLDRATAF